MPSWVNYIKQNYPMIKPPWQPAGKAPSFLERPINSWYTIFDGKPLESLDTLKAQYPLPASDVQDDIGIVAIPTYLGI